MMIRYYGRGETTQAGSGVALTPAGVAQAQRIGELWARRLEGDLLRPEYTAVYAASDEASRATTHIALAVAGLKDLTVLDMPDPTEPDTADPNGAEAALGIFTKIYNEDTQQLDECLVVGPSELAKLAIGAVVGVDKVMSLSVQDGSETLLGIEDQEIWPVYLGMPAEVHHTHPELAPWATWRDVDRIAPGLFSVEYW